jgi:hypothetical protein
MTTTYNHDHRQAIAHLFSMLSAVNHLETLAPDSVPPPAYRRVCRMAIYAFEEFENPWEAIEGATRLLRMIDPRPEPAIHGQPPSRAHWLRFSWLELVRAAATAAGHGDDDAPRWHSMTAAQLADELTYMADYQG